MLTEKSKVQTRDGRKARILTVIKNTTNVFPIAAVVTHPNGVETLETYSMNGEWSASTTSRHDLVMAREELKGVVNVYREGAIWYRDVETAMNSAGHGIQAVIDLSKIVYVNELNK